MPLKDIGNGLGILDAGPLVAQAIQLRQLQGQEAARALEAKKDEVQLQKTNAEAVTAKTKAQQELLQMAAAGDYDGVNTGLKTLGVPFSVKPHPSKAKRDSGVVIKVNPDGTESEMDWMGETKVREKFKLESELISQAAKGRQATETDVTNLATDLLQKKIADTPANAAAAARSILAASGRVLRSPDGKTKIRLGDLPPQSIADLAESEMMVNAAARAPQGSQPVMHQANKRLVPMKDVPDKDRESFTGIANANKILLRDVLPSFVQAGAKAFPGQAMFTATLQDIGAKFGVDSEEYKALKTLTGQFLFDKIKADSGAAFTEAEFQQRKALMPNETDTLAQAIAKTASLVALNARSASSRLEGLEATDHYTAGLRKMFQGFDLPGVPDSAEAQAILNAIPESIRKDSKTMDVLVSMLPPSIRDQADAMLSGTGSPTQSSFNRKLKKNFGIGE